MEKNKHNTLIQETVDFTTGQVTSQAITKSFTFESEPEFIKIYLKDVERLTPLPKGTSNILYQLLRFMTYQNEIVIAKRQKEQIAKALNLSLNTVNQSISSLMAQGVISRIATCTYLANPNLFGKGKWKDIKQLRLTITYDENGKTFKFDKTYFETDDDAQ